MSFGSRPLAHIYARDNAAQQGDDLQRDAVRCVGGEVVDRNGPFSSLWLVVKRCSHLANTRPLHLPDDTREHFTYVWADGSRGLVSGVFSNVKARISTRCGWCWDGDMRYGLRLCIGKSNGWTPT